MGVLRISRGEFSFNISDGATQEVLLAIPWRGRLSRFTLAQRDGTLAGFSFELYEAPEAVRALTSDAPYMILPPVTVAASVGYSANFGEAGKSYDFVNTETSARNSGVDRAYLKLTVSGTGVKTFDWSAAVESAVE